MCARGGWTWAVAALLMSVLALAAIDRDASEAGPAPATVVTGVARPMPATTATPSELHARASTSTPDPDPDSGAERIGRPAPDWTFDRWVRGGPLGLEDLRGKVVLLRWWTNGCHYCRTTLPVIDALRREHPSELVVVGVYHPKPPRAVTDTYVLGQARGLGFGGPIALDRDWRTLGRYWLDADRRRGWTSVSFLIDREGVVRWVHRGGEYHPSTDRRHASCDAEYRELLAALDRALKTPAAGEP